MTPHRMVFPCSSIPPVVVSVVAQRKNYVGNQFLAESETEEASNAESSPHVECQEFNSPLQHLCYGIGDLRFPFDLLDVKFPTTRQAICV